MDETIDKLFSAGIELRGNGHLGQAAEIFLEIIQKYPTAPKLGGVHMVLAGMYFDLEDFENSLTYFRKATQLKPKSELASLGLYLSYVKRSDFGLAIAELKRYLNEYPVRLYKETLKGLLGDMNNGYALKYKDDIQMLADKNGVE